MYAFNCGSVEYMCNIMCVMIVGLDFQNLNEISSAFLECLFVLRFYGPVNPVGSCRARSVYLTTRLLGRLSPLSG